MSVEFKAENRKLLDAALKAVGAQAIEYSDGRLGLWGGKVILDLKAGQALVQDGAQNRLNTVKQAYSKECIKAAAKKMQWAVKMNGNQATVTKMKW